MKVQTQVVDPLTAQLAELTDAVKRTQDYQLSKVADDYSKAFDPTSDVYSINTGNANVRQLEDLKSIMSAPPTVNGPPPDDTKYLIGIVIAVAVYFFYKG